MSFHEILIAVMAVFALLGAADRIFGNRWGLGKEFEEGILAMAISAPCWSWAMTSSWPRNVPWLAWAILRRPDRN